MLPNWNIRLNSYIIVTGGIQIQLLWRPCEGAEAYSQAKLGKKTIATGIQEVKMGSDSQCVGGLRPLRMFGLSHLTLIFGQSSSCLRPETKSEPARKRLECNFPISLVQ
jgi:hypothetical protein